MAMPHASAPIETVRAASGTVSCDGGGGALGHPRVYLTLAAQGVVDCPYCSRRFVRSAEPQNAR